MKTLNMLLVTMLVVSCTQTRDRFSRPPHYEVDYGSSPKETAEMGRKDAARHIEQGALRIIRYDMPLVRTGVWDSYYRPFVDLQVDEVPSAFDTVEYCDAYNSVMDQELKRRYGSRYLAVRADILPPSGAKHWVQESSKLPHASATK